MLIYITITIIINYKKIKYKLNLYISLFNKL